MKSLALLQLELARLDVKLSAVGDKLNVNAPAGVLTDAIRTAIRQYKPDLLAQLMTRPPAAPTDQAACYGEAKPLLVVFAEDGASKADVWRAINEGLNEFAAAESAATGPRDFQKGDRWLPWHFQPEPHIGRVEPEAITTTAGTAGRGGIQ